MSKSDHSHERERTSAWQADRRVVLVVSADVEPSLGDVVTNLSTVCAETGQRVALLSTAGLGSATGGSGLPNSTALLPNSTALLWKGWPKPGNGARYTVEDERDRLLSGEVAPMDVEHLLGETGIPGVFRLDLRHFVGHPAQVVIRVPVVVAALLQVVDVVFLEVPSYLSVHHGEGLTPLADVVLVVAERELTTTSEMRRLRATLKRLEAPVVGMALTDGGLELYDWGRVDAEIEESTPLRNHELDPTAQIPISESADVAPASPLNEFSVVERTQREA